MDREYIHVLKAYNVLSQISKRLKLGLINNEPKVIVTKIKEYIVTSN